MNKLGRRDDAHEALYFLIERTGDFEYARRLKKEVKKEKWNSYYERLVMHSKSKKRESLLSRLYYSEGDFKNAFDYSKKLSDKLYLEQLAKSLAKDFPDLACLLYNRLTFFFIDEGSGFPYTKAGKMLGSIKRLGNEMLFEKTKDEIIARHKKKYSLMDIINKI